MVLMDGRPGTQTLTIRKRPPAVEDANGVVIPGIDTPIPVDGCLAEVQRPGEGQAPTVIDGELAWFFLPVTDDTMVITPRDAIDFDNRTFEMRGPRVIRYGIDGEAVQVWCVAEWRRG